MIIKSSSYPRAALIGNPSDGYHGKTVAFTFSNFQADITLYQTEKIEILPGKRDHVVFDNLESLYEDVNKFGYYGGFRLIKAAIKKFYEYCLTRKMQLDVKNFTIRYHSSIPLHLGLAGSSAIITACMNALIIFFKISIPKPELANLVLSVEAEELGIAAGLQDRVAQVYKGIVYMDFSRDYLEKNGYGKYSRLKTAEFPLYIAYKKNLSESSDVVHNNLRYRYVSGDRQVVQAMKEFAVITDDFVKAMASEDIDLMNGLINKNFDLRKSICRISSENDEMIETARSCGASSKFTGSGGAIIGLYQDENIFNKLSETFDKMNIDVIKPRIIN